ncbi:diguanylate cyclase [Shewanella sp. 1CM18E]|uniref:tetratricopeptide repeat-containing diguanylate cyclase n=1 Tax=Shewanella sp. 1CM18E TaxID=2929169 RepID=UPI0020C06A3B|nr:GGDEF domain-containing protein [Shewanella sp. 1CM18E]MCK8043428.1 diguanylate cyclase [Shewanella sp. 1CM18E]
MKTGIFLLLFFIFSPVLASENKYDLALAEIEKSLSSSPQQVDSLLADLSSSWEDLSQEQQVQFVIYQAIKESYNGEYHSSQRLLERLEEYGNVAQFSERIYHYQVVNLIGLREYEEAFKLLDAYLKKVIDVDDINIKAKAYMRMANLALNLQAYDELGDFASKSLALSQGRDEKIHCFSLILLSYAALKQSKYNEAKEGFNQSKLFCESNTLPLFGFVSEKGLALISIQQGEVERAKNLLEQVLAGYNKYNYKIEIVSVYALLAKASLMLEQASEAERYAEKVMALNDDPSHIEHKAIAAKVLSQLYLESEQLKLAYDYLESHQHYSKLMLDDTKAKANAYQMAKFKHREQAREIALLNQERRLMETQKELDQSDQVNSFMIVTILVGSIFFLSLFLFSSHRQKIRYRKLALIDRLTGVYNRGAGQDFAENEFVQVCLRNANFSIVLFDLDFFKTINDSFGHATGDWALKHVVAVVKPLIRDGDIFTRMGGEEFALFLPYSNEQAAVDIADRCRKVIEEIDSKYSGHQFNLSASFGVSSNLVDDLSLDPILKRADLALYASKHAGRNRVTVYSDDLKGMDCHKESQSVRQTPLLS